jgi:DNA repair protein RadA/Sms
MWSAGVFEMSHSGLEAVSNTSGMFLSEQDLDSDILAGLAVVVMMDVLEHFLLIVVTLYINCHLYKLLLQIWKGKYDTQN